MDYYSITTSDVEWRAAICLCGMTTCRGSFLHYATQDDLQQVLNQNCGPLWRYATLLRSCSNLPLRSDDYAALERHGLKSAVFGKEPQNWILKYAAENLKFVEFERKALPCALMRRKDGSSSQYTYSAADMDARSVMEQRIQSMVCSFSTINEVLRRQSDVWKQSSHPVRVLTGPEAAEIIWKMLETIPGLLSVSISQLLQKSTNDKSTCSTTSSSVSSKENIQTNSVGNNNKKKKPSSSSNEKHVASAEQPDCDDDLTLKANVISATAISISKKLKTKPKELSLSMVRALCIDIQQDITKLSHCSLPTARLVDHSIQIVFIDYLTVDTWHCCIDLINWLIF